MRKLKKSFSELIKENKSKILNDKTLLEKIERRIDEK
ncbi:FbpB family small basic protein [Niallia nealsonii]|uniref:FbpB family small basic protein n=1 Tax=Niallia nealsonii TaxID=115979 RepID=A0A2N0YY96_9BACI|nr:FbpB family small basic protein [Niallia nealsonii]PKG22215.1 FbpB family small basic protein [Niallia nealsonii]